MGEREELILTDYLKMLENLRDDYKGLQVPEPEWMVKDIIQNSWDARVDKVHASGWTFSLRLFKRKSGYAVVIEDEGTTGLTGKMTTSEARQLLASGRDIPARERRVRFLGHAITWNRAQDAAGGRGQGKGVLLIANTLNTVNFESHSDDGYFAGALKRSVEGKNMVNDEADPRIVADQYFSELGPKRANGVRVLLDNPDSEIVDAILSGSIDNFILSSWWPILATKGKIVIGVLGNEREIVVSPTYLARINSYRTGEGLMGIPLIEKASSDARIIDHPVDKAAVAIAEPTLWNSTTETLDRQRESAFGVHFIRQGMVVARYTLRDNLLSVVVDLKPEVRDAVLDGFYGYIELQGIEANREAKALENPLHYGFKHGRMGRMGRSVEAFLAGPVRAALEKHGLLLQQTGATDEQERAVQSNVQSVINKLASQLGITAAKNSGTKGTNRPGGAPRMPIQIVIDNPHNGTRLEKDLAVGELEARVKNRQGCGVNVLVEFTLDYPNGHSERLFTTEAALSAGEERRIAVPEMGPLHFSEAGRYRVSGRAVLQSAGNLEVLDQELLASRTQVKVGWYREDATSLYIAIDPPRKGLIEIEEMGGYYGGTMRYQHTDLKPKVLYYSEAPAVKAAKAESYEALNDLLLEMGLRGLSEYIVNVGTPLEKVMPLEDIQQAEAEGNLIQATYFMLRSKIR